MLAISGYPYVPAWFDYGPRNGSVRAFMLHMTEGGGAVAYLDKNGVAPARGVSVHFVVDYLGRVTQMLPLDHVSGGLNPSDRSSDKPYYGRRFLREALPATWSDPNVETIQVEIEGRAVDGPNTAQVESVIKLGHELRAMFPTMAYTLGHADQTNTKACPGTSPSMLAIFDALGGHGRMAQPIYSVGAPLRTHVRNATPYYDYQGDTTARGVLSDQDAWYVIHAYGSIRNASGRFDMDKTWVAILGSPTIQNVIGWVRSDRLLGVETIPYQESAANAAIVALKRALESVF